MTRRDVDALAAELSRRQHGAFAGWQLIVRGVPQSAIDRRVRVARWLRLEPGVFAMPGSPGTWRRQVKAAQLGHPAAVVSGPAAAVLHGLPAFRPGSIEISVPRRARHTSRLAHVRRRELGAVTIVDGIRVTDLLHTLGDIAAVAPVGRLRDAVQHALLDATVEPDDLARRCQALSRRRAKGVPALRAVLDELLGGDATAETELERLMRRAIDRAGLVPVVYQASPPWWPDGPQRIDAWLPEHRTIVEADGRAWHSRVEDFERDRERDNLAAAHDHRVVRLTWRMLTERLPATLDLLRALRTAPPADSGTISSDIRR